MLVGATIRGSGPAAERLRAYVRDRVDKDGAHYGRGAAKQLAEHLRKPPSWVSNYVDSPPAANADIDTALEICAFFRVKLDEFREESQRAPPRPAEPIASRNLRRARQLLDRMSDDGHREAAYLLAGLSRAYPREPDPAHTSQPDGRTSARERRLRSRSKAVGG